jgi:peroxiredoxin
MILKKVGLIITLFCLNIVTNAQVKSLYPQGLKVGEKAPLFSAKNHKGNIIDLKMLLKKGSVVVLFYRGQWCPYCNQQLKKVNDSLQLITAKGATVLAITPETDENVQKTIEKTKAGFSIIDDKDLTIMKSYKVNFAVDENTIAKYKTYGINFDKANGSNSSNLPVPATYIIGKDGKIKYAFFDVNYTKRASVKDIIDHL